MTSTALSRLAAALFIPALKWRGFPRFLGNKVSTKLAPIEGGTRPAQSLGSKGSIAHYPALRKCISRCMSVNGQRTPPLVVRSISPSSASTSTSS